MTQAVFATLKAGALAGMLMLAPMASVQAQDDTGPADAQTARDEFVFSLEEDMFLVGTAIDLKFHEAGHMVIDVFDIPILGQEEDAADNFATLALLSMEDDFAQGSLMQGIGGWYLLGANLDGSDLQYFGVHDLSIQRASRKVCHLISAEPETYGELAQALELDESTAVGCSRQFAKTLNNWVTTLEQKNAFGQSEHEISITYYDSMPEYEPYRRILEDNGVLEYVAEYLANELALPREISITAQHCGTPNAFYLSEEGRMTYCYEFAELLHSFYLATDAAGEAPAEAAAQE